MINKENITEIIDQYLNRELDAGQLNEVENKLRDDPEFKLEVEAQRAVLENLRILGRASLTKKFKNFHQELKVESQKIEDNEEDSPVSKLWASKQFYAIAASVLLLMVSGLVLFLNRDQETPLSAENVLKIPLYDTERTGLGFAGEHQLIDSVAVQFLEHPDYDFHYQFRDTLKIFNQKINPEKSVIYLDYHADTESYILVIDSIRFAVEKGFADIKQLTRH